MSKINIGIEIDLETFLESKLLIEADSGSGKSWTIRKMAEECSGKVQQIIIDPEGDFITLREKYPFALVAKVGGDIPLNTRYAEALAHKILETGISVIIDLYEFKQHEREQFVKLFCEALMNAPKSLRHSCLVYLDEAQLFCPEDKRAISTAAVIDLCTRGRKRGLCAILATLRISILNKSAAAQCKNKLMGSTSLPLDQKRVGDELGLRTKEEIRDLRNLGKGEFYAFGPAISKEIIRFTVGKVKTTHIKSGSKLLSVPPTPAAIKKILSKLEDIPEEAEKELVTKKQYQDEIKRLNVELKKKPVAAAGKTITVPDEKAKQQVAHLKGELEKEKKYSATLLSINKTLKGVIEKAAKTFEPYSNITLPEQPKSTPIMMMPQNTIPHVKSEPPKISYKPQNNVSIVGGAMRMLKSAAMFYPNVITRAQMGAFSRMSHTGGSFGTYLSSLKSNGYIITEGADFRITDEGLAAAGDVEPLPTDPQELINLWCGIIGESSGAARMLRKLGEHYPHEMSRQELGESVGVTSSGGSFGTYLSYLKSRGLVKTSGQNIKASEELFL
jgi:hypothetical protein